MDRDVTIYQCCFQAYIEKASVFIKFPCTYFLEWKTVNNRTCVEGRGRPSATDSLINFQQTLSMHTELVYDNSLKKFIKKETLLNLNLVSKSRQNQVKLVGRVTIDLAEIANNNIFQQLKTYRLSYCSVDGEICFSASMKSSKHTNMTPHDLDTSSYNQYLSFCSFPTLKEPRREAMAQYDQETSLEFTGRRATQNAIDLFPQNQRNNRNFNQTFFIMPSSPRQNSFNRTSQFPKLAKQKSLQSQTVYSVTRAEQLRRQVAIGKHLNALSVGSKEEQLTKQHEKANFRDEIDGNRHKIQELQKKILQLCANLQDSKRQVQISERQNKQKQELIQKLKNNSIQLPKAQLQIGQLQARYDRLLQQRKEEQKRAKVTEQTLKKEVALANAGNENLRRETEQLRKIWTEKKEHYQEKFRHFQYIIKQKQSKLNEFLNKIEQLSKFKYQYELMKQLNEEKESKIKMVEKDLLKMSKELQDLKRDNLGEENLKLKINCSQSAKNIEELAQRYAKCQEEVSRHKENYIKISTAYEIQSKNYENNKEKYTILEGKYYEMQRENIELKNNLANFKLQYQQLSNTSQEATANLKQLKNQFEDQKRKFEVLKQEIKSLNQQNSTLRTLVEKFKLQSQIRSGEYQNELKRVENTFMASLQSKQRSYNSQKKQLQQALNKANQLHNTKVLQHRQLEQTLLSQKQSLTQELIVKDEELRKKVMAIQRLNEIIADKQQIIKLSKQQNEALKQANKQLGESLVRMKEKQKQMNRTIIVLEQQSQKILQALEQKELVDKELEQIKHQYQSLSQQNLTLKQSLNQSSQNIIQLQGQINELRHKIEQLQSLLSFKTEQLSSKDYQLQNIVTKLQEHQFIFQKYKSETNQSLNEADKLKQIIKQINERYQEHLKVEERYSEEISHLRQEKDEIQVIMNNQINQVVGHSQEMQNRIGLLEQETERLEHALRGVQEEKRQIQQLYQEAQRSLVDSNTRLEQAQANISLVNQQLTNIQTLQAEKQTLISSYQSTIQSQRQQIELLSLKIPSLQQTILEQNTQLDIRAKNNEELSQIISQKTNQNMELEQNIIQLNDQIAQLRQQINQQQPYNQEINYSPNTVQEEHPISNRETELQQMLFQSDSKNQTLLNKVNDLMAQVEELQKIKQPSDSSQGLYSTFPEFQREQMNKIIEEQRQEIQHLEAQLQKQSDSSALEQRIAQLQTHIIELQGSFKLELQRALASQDHREDVAGTLAVITQETSEDEMLYRSERSLVNSLSRIKSSFDGLQLVQLKQKFHGLQQEKNRLQEQFNMMQQQKFNLLSTINQKDIYIQDLTHEKNHLTSEVRQLHTINSNLNSKIKDLNHQIETLRSQLTFGSHLGFPNEQSVTRSEPFIVGQSRIVQNKDIQIENLMAEIQRQKVKEEELLWNIKDLEMQLQTVTENLNTLNASSMNSVLITTERTILEDERSKQGRSNGLQGYRQGKNHCQEGYSKERLLQNLKKNQELKQLSHNLIRALKQRQKDSKQQEQLFRDLRGNQQIIQSQYSLNTSATIKAIRSKTSILLRQFQLIKLYLMKLGVNRVTEDESDQRVKQADIMKNLLGIQEGLGEIKVISERELGQVN